MKNMWEELCDRFHAELEKTGQTLKLSVMVVDAFNMDSYLEVREDADGKIRLYFSTMGRRMLNWHMFVVSQRLPRGERRVQRVMDEMDVILLLRREALSKKEWRFLESELQQIERDGKCESHGYDGYWITIDYYPDDAERKRWRYWSYPPQEWQALGTVTSFLGQRMAQMDGERLRTPQGDRMVAEWKAREKKREAMESEKRLRELEGFIRAHGAEPPSESF